MLRGNKQEKEGNLDFNRIILPYNADERKPRSPSKDPDHHRIPCKETACESKYQNVRTSAQMK